MKPAITKDILIEDLVDNYSFSVRFLMEQGIRCIMCGEPIWGTLEEAAREKGFTDQQINGFVREMIETEKRVSEEEGYDKVAFDFSNR